MNKLVTIKRTMIINDKEFELWTSGDDLHYWDEEQIDTWTDEFSPKEITKESIERFVEKARAAFFTNDFQIRGLLFKELKVRTYGCFESFYIPVRKIKTLALRMECVEVGNLTIKEVMEELPVYEFIEFCKDNQLRPADINYLNMMK